MPKHSKKQKNLMKSELQYSKYSESDDENLVEEEDRSLIKRKDTDDDEGDGKEIELYDNSK
jgi:hypothetical protein